MIKMSTKKLEEVFLRKKPVRLLFNIKMGDIKYVSVLAKETDCTYSHTVKLLEEFRKFGIVEFEKEGRIKYIKLTSEGTELVNGFESVFKRFAKLGKKK